MTSGSEHSHPEDVDCWAGCPASPEYPAPRVTNRGTEAWDDHPGDSTAEVDYPDDEKAPGEQVIGQTDETVQLTKFEGEISVDVTIYLPDGTRFNFSEAWPADDVNDATADEVRELLDAVTTTARSRFSR